ncbi:MAG: hypothetical protein B7X79_19085 [Acidovorax sp. 17-64-282]|nr:MAG: hypothetical protein B7X79_19085 [Acidovorax sp. 17-64-282]
MLWAAHAVHHQSQDYNLSTALRQTSSGALLGWVFYVPMALAGVPPLVFAVVALIDLLYQFWVHTEQVGKLGWFDRWFCSPSNHRVHHAVNDAYLDKNYGGILILWDRIFGTFKDEDDKEKCVYGTRGLLNSWDPLWANAQVYAGLAHDSWHARSWGDKLRVWLKPPGWRPADVAQRFPKPAFDIARMPRYNPAMTPATRWFASVQFVLLLVGVSVFLWHADSAPLAHNTAWFAALLATQWALGAVVQGRISMLLALMIEAGALATATSAVGWTEWHLMYAFLWAGGLPAALRGPVAAYVLVIALMAAQALRRARVLGTSAARMVAVGACLFMVSDSLLATSRFVQALPMSQFWVLSTYYAAQVLIVWGWLRGQSQEQADARLGVDAAQAPGTTPAPVETYPAAQTSPG